MTGSSVLIYAFKFLFKGADESATTDDPRAPNVFPRTWRNAMRDQHWW
jgi:hypothetical protein